MSTIYGNPIGGIGRERTYILVDEDGNEIPAVVSDMEVVFDAGENDIRAGKVAASANGVVTGTKDIPSYNTSDGYTLIPSGSAFAIYFDDILYDFTKLQVIICPFSGSVSASVAAEKVVIGENVYNVNSATPICSVSRDADNKVINLGITNDSGSLYLLRYFTYKEIY